jgi:hypothetical protein
LSVYAYGWRIGIRVNKPEVVGRVAERLPPGWEPGCSPLVDRLYSFRVGGPAAGSRVRNYTLLYSGLTQLARTMDVAAVALPAVMSIVAPKAWAGFTQFPTNCPTNQDGTTCFTSPSSSGTYCSGKCIDSSTFLLDNNNCGSCGNKCTAN